MWYKGGKIAILDKLIIDLQLLKIFHILFIASLFLLHYWITNNQRVAILLLNRQ